MMKEEAVRVMDEAGLVVELEGWGQGAEAGLRGGGVGVVMTEGIEAVAGGLVGVAELAFVISDVGVEGVTAVYAHFL